MSTLICCCHGSCEILYAFSRGVCVLPTSLAAHHPSSLLYTESGGYGGSDLAGAAGAGGGRGGRGAGRRRGGGRGRSEERRGGAGAARAEGQGQGQRQS